MNTWTKQYQTNDMMWPNEMLIRMFKGTRMKHCNFDKSLYREQSIIDVGCGDCNNFPLYKQLGFLSICGVEITDDIVCLNKKRMDDLEISSDIRVGTNDNIPFSNESFDYLVSWNASYYMGTPENHFTYDIYVNEFARVLKKGGIFIFSIPMSSHAIYENADPLDDKYVIIRNDNLNIRNGLVMRRFCDESDIRSELSNCFEKIEFGKLQDNYFGTNGHWHIGYGYKYSN